MPIPPRRRGSLLPRPGATPPDRPTARPEWPGRPCPVRQVPPPPRRAGRPAPRPPPAAPPASRTVNGSPVRASRAAIHSGASALSKRTEVSSPSPGRAAARSQAGELLRARREADLHPVGLLLPAPQPPPHELLRLHRQLPPCEPGSRGERLVDPVHPEGPPVLPLQVVGDQVPPAPRAHQPVRLHQPPRLGPVPRPVGEPQPLRPGHRPGHHRQRPRVHARPVPPRQRDRGRLQRAHPVPQPRGQDLLQLRQGPYGGLLDPLDRVPGPRPQPHRDRHGLLVVEEQRRHRRPRHQPVPALGAQRGLHRVAELPQPLDVAPDRPCAHPEPLCQLAPGPFARGLEEGQQGEQPCGGVGHESRLPAK